MACLNSRLGNQTRLMSQLGTGKANRRKNTIYLTRSSTGGNILHNLHSYALSSLHITFRLFVDPPNPSRFYPPLLIHIPYGFLASVHPCIHGHMPSRSYAFMGSSFAPRPFQTYKRTPVVIVPKGLHTSKRTLEIRLQASWPFATSQCTPDELPRPRVSVLCT